MAENAHDNQDNRPSKDALPARGEIVHYPGVILYKPPTDRPSEKDAQQALDRVLGIKNYSIGDPATFDIRSVSVPTEFLDYAALDRLRLAQDSRIEVLAAVFRRACSGWDMSDVRGRALRVLHDLDKDLGAVCAYLCSFDSSWDDDALEILVKAAPALADERILALYDRDAYSRSESLRLLSLCNPRRARELAPAMLGDANAEVREAARRVLSSDEEDDEYSEPQRKLVDPDMRNKLNSAKVALYEPEAAKRKQAVESVTSSDPRLAICLLSSFTTMRSAELRIFGLQRLQEINPRLACKLAEAMTSDLDPQVSQFAKALLQGTSLRSQQDG